MTLAGVVPDADGLGMFAELVTRHTSAPLYWWSQYHHVLGHNIGFASLVGCLALAFSRRKPQAVALAILTFHLHLLGDLIGARGPDGSQWPIPYFLPFAGEPALVWKGQWELNAWPNARREEDVLDRQCLGPVQGEVCRQTAGKEEGHPRSWK